VVAGGVDDGGAAAGADFEVVQVVVVVDEHAVMVSALFFPVLVSVARTFCPVFGC
jgi:hypothetical protein